MWTSTDKIKQVSIERFGLGKVWFWISRLPPLRALDTDPAPATLPRPPLSSHENWIFYDSATPVWALGWMLTANVDSKLEIPALGWLLKVWLQLRRWAETIQKCRPIYGFPTLGMVALCMSREQLMSFSSETLWRGSDVENKENQTALLVGFSPCFFV